MKNMPFKRSDAALLVTRLILGGIFIYSGWMKVSDMPATIGFFAQMGIPAFLAYAVAYIELIGGVLVVLGAFTCLAAAALAVIMIFAIWFTRTGGMQMFGLPLATLAGLIALVGVCGGKYSLKDCCGRGCCEDGTCSTETPKV